MIFEENRAGGLFGELVLDEKVRHNNTKASAVIEAKQ